MSVISAEHVERAGSILVIAKGDVVTPLARDRANELGVKIEVGPSARPPSSMSPPSTPANRSASSPAPPSTRTQQTLPNRSIEAPSHLAAFSGALYRRGAPLPAAMDPTPETATRLANDARPKAAVIGAGHVGATTTLRLVETSLFSEVVMVDVVPGLAEGLTLDIWH